MKKITLVDLANITVGANSLVMVKMENGKMQEISKFTLDELEGLQVLTAVGTTYPSFTNVIEVTVNWKKYRKS